MTTTQKFTRQDYLDGKCTHREYYSQFVTNGIKNSVLSSFGDELFSSKDEHFNDIKLTRWDMLANYAVRGNGVSEKMKERGDYLTLAGSVCILKEAAKQIKENA